MKQYFAGRTKQLNEEIDKVISNVDNPVLRGTHAENILKQFLESVLPEKYKIDMGLVYGIDEGGKVYKSKQVDLVIYDGYQTSPLQKLSGFKIFPIECVYACIGVKIPLNSNTLLKGRANCYENILSVKEIPKINYTNRH